MLLHNINLILLTFKFFFLNTNLCFFFISAKIRACHNLYGNPLVFTRFLRLMSICLDPTSLVVTLSKSPLLNTFSYTYYSWFLCQINSQGIDLVSITIKEEEKDLVNPPYIHHIKRQNCHCSTCYFLSRGRLIGANLKLTTTRISLDWV